MVTFLLATTSGCGFVGTAVMFDNAVQSKRNEKNVLEVSDSVRDEWRIKTGTKT